MEIRWAGTGSNDFDALVVPVWKEHDKPSFNLTSEFQYADLSDFIEATGFEGENKELGLYFTGMFKGPSIVILAGLGKKEKIDLEVVRRAFGAAAKEANKRKVGSLGVSLAMWADFNLGEQALSRALAEVSKMALYRFDSYKQESEKTVLDSVSIITETDIKDSLEEGSILADATLTTRRLVNEPANVLTPEALASEAQILGRDYGFEVEILGLAQIRALRMEAFLAVGQASDKEPRLIVMRYFGDPDSDERIGLVGKGVTYDTGGLSLKPTDSMIHMKSDMGGAGTVIGAMAAIAKRKTRKNVIAVVAACENSVAGNAYKPGDIISSMAGKTIEIRNTDAEGRLTLIDAVHYIIEKEEATSIIDAATLTGAALVALGNHVTAVVSNDDSLCQSLTNASALCGEKFWRLPIDDEYIDLIKSDQADLSNLGKGRLAGTITAGAFIGEFVQEKPWLHLDIAGTSWSDNEREYVSKGGTGTGVRTLYHLVQSL